ncbi:hypothetical protein C8Q73DRAFT_46545 [Cubamyces lactineus]|nr:hypothetical protein C8Q73DRAFT_46545 [Cubamyces lactineus]
MQGMQKRRAEFPGNAPPSLTIRYLASPPHWSTSPTRITSRRGAILQQADRQSLQPHSTSPHLILGWTQLSPPSCYSHCPQPSPRLTRPSILLSTAFKHRGLRRSPKVVPRPDNESAPQWPSVVIPTPSKSVRLPRTSSPHASIPKYDAPVSTGFDRHSES